MSKIPRFETAIEELTYYKNLTDTTVDCIINNSAAIIQEQAEKVRLCGTRITVGTVQGKEKVTSANFCRLRLCPLCQRRKSLKTYAEISRLVAALPSRTWVHIVLTLRNVSAAELQQTIDKLFKDSTALLRKNSQMQNAFNGALRCLEVTYNSESKTFHPHLHILLTGDKSLNNNSRKRISRKLLQQLWKEAAQLDYLPQVHIDYTVDEGVVAEIAKYCVKPLELQLPSDERAQVIEQLYTVLHGRRLVQSYGEIRTTLARLKIDLNASPENGTKDNSETTEQMFVYNFTHSRYEEVKDEFTDSRK